MTEPRFLGVYVLPNGRRIHIDTDATVPDLLDVIEQLMRAYDAKRDEVREWIGRAHDWAL